MKAIIVASIMATAAALAAEREGFVPLFNQLDLNGWVNVNCAPETWTVRNGNIHCTGHPVGALRTPRQYENFILELEWRHLENGGNSGVFIWATPLGAPGVPFLRGIEVQVLDHGFNVPGKNEWYTTHGDVFPIHGATMKPFGRHNGERSFPSEERSKGSPEWNHYRVVCNNGVLRLHVNSKEVSGGENCNYRKGYLGLESEGAPVEFRNIFIQELPPGNAQPETSAPVERGLRSIFNGLDLRGWKTNSATEKYWHVRGENITLEDGVADDKAVLWTEKDFTDAEYVLDCRPAKLSAGNQMTPPKIILRGPSAKEVGITLQDATPGKYQRFTIAVKGRTVSIQRNNEETRQVTLPKDALTRGSFGLSATGNGIQFMNLYARELN
jgi:hypothetical protein